MRGRAERGVGKSKPRTSASGLSAAKVPSPTLKPRLLLISSSCIRKMDGRRALEWRIDSACRMRSSTGKQQPLRRRPCPLSWGGGVLRPAGSKPCCHQARTSIQVSGSPIRALPLSPR